MITRLRHLKNRRRKRYGCTENFQNTESMNTNKDRPSQKPQFSNYSVPYMSNNYEHYDEKQMEPNPNSNSKQKRAEIFEQNKLNEFQRTTSQPLFHIENDKKYSNHDTFRTRSKNCTPNNLGHYSYVNLLDGRQQGHLINKDESSDDGGFLVKKQLPENIKRSGESSNFSRVNSRRYSVSHNENDSSEWIDIPDNSLKDIEPKLKELFIDTVTTDSNCKTPSATKEGQCQTPTSCNPVLPITTNKSSLLMKTTKISNNVKQVAQQKMLSTDTHQCHNLNEKNGRNSKKGSMQNDKRKVSSDVTAQSNRKMQSIFSTEAFEMVSTTTRSIDMDSITDYNSYDDDGESGQLVDIRAIKRQLLSLESMYSEAIKLMKRPRFNRRYHQMDRSSRMSKKMYGSISSIPSSSVSSRPIRDYNKKRVVTGHDDNKHPRDNKRFQRLESHVITLARSIAQLSSEMRDQHVMIQEIEELKLEIDKIKSLVTNLTQTNNGVSNGNNQWVHDNSGNFANLTNPQKAKKLKKFFGDEPPLLRLFLRKLGYEKYANLFEKEQIGIVELPYLNEDRLLKLGLPLGPRLRILREAQQSLCTTLCVI